MIAGYSPYSSLLPYSSSHSLMKRLKNTRLMVSFSVVEALEVSSSSNLKKRLTVPGAFFTMLRQKESKVPMNMSRMADTMRRYSSLRALCSVSGRESMPVM